MALPTALASMATARALSVFNAKAGLVQTVTTATLHTSDQTVLLSKYAGGKKEEKKRALATAPLLVRLCPRHAL